jgi:hypothetical protein
MTAIIRNDPHTGTSTTQYYRAPTHNNRYWQSTQSNPAHDQNSAYSLGMSVGGDPALRSTYERLYGNSGPLKLPQIRSQDTQTTSPAPAMPDIPPAMMQQIMASLAQRGFGASKGKPKLASKIAGDQWRSLVDQQAQEAYGSGLMNQFQIRTGQPNYLSLFTKNMLNPEYVKALYEV